MSKKKRTKKTGSDGSPKPSPKKPKTSSPKVSNKPDPAPLPEPKLPPMPDPNPSADHPASGGSARLIVGSRDPAEGSPIDPTEEFRRQQAERLEVERIAKSFGFSVTTRDTYTPHHDQTPRAAEIAAKAGKPMSDLADTVRLRRRTLKVTRPDGTTIEATENEL